MKHIKKYNRTHSKFERNNSEFEPEKIKLFENYYSNAYDQYYETEDEFVSDTSGTIEYDMYTLEPHMVELIEDWSKLKNTKYFKETAKASQKYIEIEKEVDKLRKKAFKELNNLESIVNYEEQKYLIETDLPKFIGRYVKIGKGKFIHDKIRKEYPEIIEGDKLGLL